VVRDDGSTVTADVRARASSVDVEFTVGLAGSGPTAQALRTELVEAVFGLPEVSQKREFHASLPLGEIDLLAALRPHCRDMRTRAAGSTCFVDATLIGASH
jgi:hypothetical protein